VDEDIPLVLVDRLSTTSGGINPKMAKKKRELGV
jgi:hypothetical protein